MGEGALNISNEIDRQESATLVNSIAEGSTFEGILKSSKSFAVGGTVIGQISTPSAVIVGKSGILRGDVDCDIFDLSGTCEGRARVDSKVTLQKDATLSGDVSCGVLVVDSGARIQGRLRTQKYRA